MKTARYIDIEPYERQENWTTRVTLVIESGVSIKSIPVYSIQTADVVEVVRCKDCALRYDSCPMAVRVSGYVQFFTEDDDFCSRGRRREE